MLADCCLEAETVSLQGGGGSKPEYILPGRQREVESVTEVRLHCGVNYESFFNFNTFKFALCNH